MSDPFANEAYLSLATFRKSGDEVATPVWFVELDGRFCVFSAGEAGKVKRLRNSSRARIAPCNATGVLKGEWVDANAWLVDDKNEIDRIERALVRKYGWQARMINFFSGISGKRAQRAYIVVERV